MDDESEYLRLPRPGQHCPVTGLKRTSLSDILKERDPDTGEKLVLSIVRRQERAKRGITLIKKDSLIAYLDRHAQAQRGLRFAPHIGNPDNRSIDDVLSDIEMFHLFLGPDIEFTMDDWTTGKLSTRKARLMALIDVGAVIKE